MRSGRDRRSMAMVALPSPDNISTIGRLSGFEGNVWAILGIVFLSPTLDVIASVGYTVDIVMPETAFLIFFESV